MLDAARTTMFGPIGIALLCAALERRRLAGLERPVLVPPTDIHAADFLHEIGFPPLDATGSLGPRPTLHVRQLTAFDPVYVGAVCRLIADGVPGTSEDVTHVIEVCLNELLQNVFLHSESPFGCFVLARWYLRTRNVRLAIADGGAGIPAVLRRNVPSLQRLSDVQAVEAAATQWGLTSKHGRRGGLGLKTTRDIVTQRGGRLTILSYKAKVTFLADRTRTTASQRFRGTAIEPDFRPQADARRSPSGDEIL